MKNLFYLIVNVLFAITSFAQSPDFAGNWKLNSGKSKLGVEFSVAPLEIIISQSDNELKVEKHSNFNGQEFITKDSFTLDGKESINPGIQDTQKKSTATWSEDKLSLKIISKMSSSEMGEISITEIFKMTENNMVIELSASSSYGELTETEVYDKQ